MSDNYINTNMEIKENKTKPIKKNKSTQKTNYTYKIIDDIISDNVITDVNTHKINDKPIKKNKSLIKISNNNNNSNNNSDNSDNIIPIKKNGVKNDIWTHILTEKKYDGKGELIISADEIKKCGKTWKGTSNQFEPRLLCKQDCEDDRPQIFKDYGVYIISIKNGEYLITKNSIYFKLKYQNVKMNFINKNSDSLLLNIGDSESSLIDNLRYSGLFENEKYLNEPILFGSLLNGRHRCSFKTKIGTQEIEISGSQYEVDACFESKNKILLIECKCINDIKSFNIRQLYYPYRTIYDKVKGKKQIITLFINKDKNNHIHIWKFEFEVPLVMTSIKNTKYDKYELTNDNLI
jgi:hypothetical protein